jgi:FkbM family methyltransferase
MSFDSSIENRIKHYNETNPIKNILHIGACLGEEVSFYEQFNPNLVYWFEPNPKLLTRLTENVKGKPFTNIVFPYAVSNKKGTANFNIIENRDGSNPGCSSLQDLKLHSELYPDIKKVDTCVVETINVDEFLLENKLETQFDLVSLDTQGHDFEILTSSDFILNAKLIVIETASIELYEGQQTDTKIEEFLMTKGFIKDYYHAFHSVWGDTLFVKQD